MFDSETRWFIRCDTCPNDRITGVRQSAWMPDKDQAAYMARASDWDIRDDLHRCPDCIREGRTERAS